MQRPAVLLLALLAAGALLCTEAFVFSRRLPARIPLNSKTQGSSGVKPALGLFGCVS